MSGGNLINWKKQKWWSTHCKISAPYVTIYVDSWRIYFEHGWTPRGLMAGSPTASISGNLNARKRGSWDTYFNLSWAKNLCSIKFYDKTWEKCWLKILGGKGEGIKKCSDCPVWAIYQNYVKNQSQTINCLVDRNIYVVYHLNISFHFIFSFSVLVIKVHCDKCRRKKK